MNRRLAGILVPAFSLRGENDLGIGDVSSLHEFVSFASETGFGFIQLLPINETGPDNSPYNAISSVAIEPMTLDCRSETLSDLSREAFEKVIGDYDVETLNSGNVDYVSVRKLKHGLLRAAYEGFMANVFGRVDVRAEAFEAFLEKEADWVNDYCVFRYLMAKEGGSQVWQEWEEKYRGKDKAIAALTAEAGESKEKADEIDRELRYYAYVQWLAFGQWKEVAEYAASKDICLMGDIPFGVSLFSTDVWANLDIFDLDWYGGAPPETLFKDDEFVQKWGQNWGIPNYRWDVIEDRNYDWWCQRIEKTTEIFGMFRVDHALGFYRIYSFPWNPVRNEEFLPLSHDEAAERCDGRLPGFRPLDDESEENRISNRKDGEKYLRMIQDAAGDAEVIAEDLGTVPPYVRPSLDQLGIAGMKVPQWEFTDGHVTSGLKYPACSFATYATHDHAPLATQWDAAKQTMETTEVDSPEWTEARDFLAILCAFAGIERPDEVAPDYSDGVWTALFRQLSFSHSDRVAVMITDLLSERDRINVPGVLDGTNWSYRLPVSSRDLLAHEDHGDLREMTKNVLNETGRARSVGGF
ncbi:MAG: 4-alpha-glucanotransferase [Verrucomicrobiales bacterium]|nr:4-alpha-glucanotransferase [Verrucomicrobiales bacterium]